mmetsp:Transcript_3233/g.4955  ORF Transcript_3233/g.4955 Transcript_3233/m.4955 type:complete len:151 (+) Transcript_3233:83-535(+)
MAKSPGRRAWGAIAPKQNVSLLNIMSEQLATEIQKGGDGNPKNTSPATASPHIMQELKAMGFSSTRINTAALATGNRRTESALEWLLANPADEAVQDDDEEDHADTQNNNSERLSIEVGCYEQISVCVKCRYYKCINLQFNVVNYNFLPY